MPFAIGPDMQTVQDRVWQPNIVTLKCPAVVFAGMSPSPGDAFNHEISSGNALPPSSSCTVSFAATPSHRNGHGTSCRKSHSDCRVDQIPRRNSYAGNSVQKFRVETRERTVPKTVYRDQVLTYKVPYEVTVPQKKLMRVSQPYLELVESTVDETYFETVRDVVEQNSNKSSHGWRCEKKLCLTPSMCPNFAIA